MCILAIKNVWTLSCMNYIYANLYKALSSMENIGLFQTNVPGVLADLDYIRIVLTNDYFCTLLKSLGDTTSLIASSFIAICCFLAFLIIDEVGI